MSEIVITGVGAVTAAGVGLEAQWEASAAPHAPDAKRGLDDFQAAPHVTDRRMLKAVSKTDAVGLVGIEDLIRTARLAPGQVDPERSGLYVGAPAASSHDQEPYVGAVAEAGRSVRAFGRTCMASRPTTLLIGLPNNVLCYGSMLLDARGPNSNYTASATSGVMATLNAARRLRRGQLDRAVAGGFSLHDEPIDREIFARLGLTPGMTVADGAAFVALEARAAAKARGVEPLAGYRGGALASDGLGPLRYDREGRGVERALRAALADARATPSEVGLVLAPATGDAALDAILAAATARVFGKGGALPALATLHRRLGQLIEAGGVLEVGVAARLHAAGEVPAGLTIDTAPAAPFGRRIDPGRPLTMILVASAWGEYGVLVTSRES